MVRGLIFSSIVLTKIEGDVGRKFADSLAAHFNEKTIVAGHTVTIHVLHQGLVVKRPGKKSDWGDGEVGTWCYCTDMSHWEING